MITLTTNEKASMSKVEVLVRGDVMELSSKHVDSILLALSYAIEEGYFAEDVELREDGLKVLRLSKGDYSTCTKSVRKNLLGGDFPMILSEEDEDEGEHPTEFHVFEEDIPEEESLPEEPAQEEPLEGEAKEGEEVVEAIEDED
mgnify:CR=1 FL=1